MIALDTHALVWWVSDPSKLGARARKAIDAAVKAGDQIAVSSISTWEIAMLVAADRLQLTMDVATWVARVELVPGLTFVPVDNHIALRAVQLDDFPHRDPADRIIVATALSLGATLVTADERIRAYKAVRTVWK
jgi:PIN domain nuclease of toxin-antitoxin system